MNQKSVMWRLTARALSPGTEVFVNRRAACPKYPEYACIARNAGISPSGFGKSVRLPLPRTLGLSPSRRPRVQPTCVVLVLLPLRAASAAILTGYLKHPVSAMGRVPLSDT